MARTIEERIQELRQLRNAATGNAVELALKKALADKSNLVVAEAAKAVGERRHTNLIPELLDAFGRLFDNPTKSDSKCWGKTAIVKALAALDYSEAAPFLRGASHIQMEPVWGGQEDAAIHLRANATLALVQCADLTRSEKFRHLVDAMTDASDTVRIEAVRAVEQLNGEESIVLLRLKARIGDKRPAVAGQVFDALLQLERERAVDFVAQFLASADEAIRDEAALALGSSRLTGAVSLLIETWKTARAPEFRSTLLRALSVSREETALAFLLQLVSECGSRDAASALAALALHDSPEILARVEQARRSSATSRRSPPS